MKLELLSAANFLVHLIRLGRKHTGGEAQLESFRLAVVEVLRRRYRDHWFPEKPFKGSGYRCIRINGKVDPVIVQAAESVGMPTNTIHQTFPSELTMWIDPLEVSYRIGDNGSICVLYEYKENHSQHDAWKPTSSGISSDSSSNSKGSSSSELKHSSSSSVSPVKAVDNLPKSTPTTPSHYPLNNLQSTNLNKNNLNNAVTAMNSKNTSSSSSASTAACKDSLYKIDCLLDPRKSSSFDQLAAFVSS